MPIGGDKILQVKVVKHLGIYWKQLLGLTSWLGKLPSEVSRLQAILSMQPFQFKIWLSFFQNVVGGQIKEKSQEKWVRRFHGVVEPLI